MDHVIELAKKTTTKFYVVDTSAGAKNKHSCVNLGGHIVANILRYIDISYVDKFLVSHYIQIIGTSANYSIGDKKDVNLKSAINYETVRPEVYVLTSESTSEEIRSAFSSVTSFKKVIEAVQNGAILRTSIPESLIESCTNPIYLNTFAAYIENNGDARLGYVIAGLGINSFIGMQFVTIDYNATSDSFSIIVVPLAIEG